jgi:hypothetical protein
MPCRKAAPPFVEMIDVTFDFRSDTPPGKDADAFSPTLRTYNQLLWSKRLPGGALFELDVGGRPPYYLHHRSDLGEFWLSSDWAVPNFLYLASIIDQIPEVKREALWPGGYTIGASMVFPAQWVDGKRTINVARAFHPNIKDRFDLTLECIRRHYLGESSPLGGTLARYAEFFGLFGDFSGYVEFFLLQDLVTEDSSAVRFFMPFEDFTGSPLPGTVDEYLGYREHALEYIESRNRRIAAYVAEHPLDGVVATGGRGWQDREDDLRRLVDQVTATFFPPPERLAPIGLERGPAFDYYRRYLPVDLPDRTCQCAVGVILEPPNQGTPFWLRYQRAWCKANFQSVADRIMTSRFAADVRSDDGRVWVPLRVSPDGSRAAIVDELVEQIEAIRAVAAGAEAP